jgi:hypothetical protein
MLSWKHFCDDKSITPALCSTYGIGSETLHTIQPCLQKWIDVCHVSFGDVGYMVHWPLHPIHDLDGYIPDLIANAYDAPLLLRLGIDYPYLISKNMTIELMKLFKFTTRDWALLKFNTGSMSDYNLHRVFDTDRSTLEMILSSHTR